MPTLYPKCEKCGATLGPRSASAPPHQCWVCDACTKPILEDDIGHLMQYGVHYHAQCVPKVVPPDALGKAKQHVDEAFYLGGKRTYPSGATSSGEVVPFYLMPLRPLRRLLLRFGLGLIKHGLNNWMRGLGDEAWETDRYNHTVNHLFEYAAQRWHGAPEPNIEGDNRIDNLSAAAWGCIILIEAEERRVEGGKC